ncbi:MAG: oligosaccharide repeat unit polymerase [Epsilonproteobacteria bacterium]|nr:oligosaccharide repeat unit polymerase [Campylobacterota bacterium]
MFKFDIFILFLLYLSLLIYIFRYIFDSVRYGWNMVAVFLAFWMVEYLIVPLSMILNDSIFFLDYKLLDLYVEHFDIDRYYNLYTFFTISIFISIFFLGVNLAKAGDEKRFALKERRITILSQEINILFLIGLFLAVLSFASVFIYASQFGGMERAIEAADAVRSGHGDEYWISKQFIFVYRFIPFSILSIIIFFLLKGEKSFWVWVMFLLALWTALFSRFVLFKSKQAIIELLLLYMFYLSLKNRKSYLFHFGVFFLIAVFLIPALESYLDTGKFAIPEASNIVQAIFNMLTFFNFDQTSLFFTLHENYDFVYFEGVISGLRGKLIPMSWLTSMDNNTIFTNTYFFYNLREAIVPPGVVAFGYYNFGAVGVVLVALFSGYLIKKVDYFFINATSYEPKFIILYAFAMTKVFTWVRTGIPKFTFYDTILIVLYLIISIGYRRERIDVTTGY